MELKPKLDFQLKRPLTLTFLLWLVIGFLVCQYIYSFAKLPFHSLFIDFGHFYYHTQVLENFESKKNIATSEDIFYTLLGEAVNPPYKDETEYSRQAIPHAWGNVPHPPLFYILLRPLTRLKYIHAAVFWLIFNQILLVLGIIFCVATLKKKISLVELAAIVFITANFLPLRMNNILGQTSIIIFFLISLAFYSFIKKKNIVAGVALGLAVLLRWFPGLLILYFILKRQYRVVLVSLLTIALGFVVSIWRLGLPLHLIQLKYMPYIYFQYAVGAFNSQSLSGFFYRLLVRTVKINLPYLHNLGNINFIQTQGIIDNPFLANSIIFLFSFAFMFISLFICRKKTEKDTWRLGLELSLFVSLMPILSTCVTVPFMPVLLFVFIFIFLYLDQADSKILEYLLFIAAYILIGLEYWLDGIRFFWHGLWVVFLSGKLYGAVLLWLLCLRLLITDKGGRYER